MKCGRVYIGTSGWNYRHWKGTFYPPGTRAAAEFPYYQETFNTVEINNSFYKLPPPETFKKWRETTSRDFVFAVKANRFLTHAKKLIVDKASIRRFFTSVNKLEEKLGVILFQLPPKWKVNVERLHDFIKALPTGYRYTFEFREPSWYTKEVYDVLKKYNCAFCIYELAYHLSPMEVTADFIYIRLHGPGEKYQGSYPTEKLTEWAKLIKKWRAAGRDVFIYFDNDEAGYAAFNAASLKEMLPK